MARAAAKRKPRTPQPPRRDQKRVKQPQPVEKTLFFSRIRRQTKWVFAALALVFAVTFVVAGVGSGSTGFGSIVDALGGIFGTNKGGGSSNPSVKKAQERIAKNPKDAAAYRDLARAHELDKNTDGAIGALEDYLKLNVPKADRISALNELSGLYETKARLQLNDAQLAYYNLQTVGATFGPSPGSPLGKAYAKYQDPIRQVLVQQAQLRYQQAASLLTQTYAKLKDVYRRLTVLDPTEPSYLFLYGQTAQYANDTQTAIAAYKKFLKLFPDDPSAPDVRRQLKQLQQGS